MQAKSVLDGVAAGTIAFSLSLAGPKRGQAPSCPDGLSPIIGACRTGNGYVTFAIDP